MLLTDLLISSWWINHLCWAVPVLPLTQPWAGSCCSHQCSHMEVSVCFMCGSAAPWTQISGDWTTAAASTEKEAPFIIDSFPLFCGKTRCQEPWCSFNYKVRVWKVFCCSSAKLCVSLCFGTFWKMLELKVNLLHSFIHSWMIVVSSSASLNLCVLLLLHL